MTSSSQWHALLFPEVYRGLCLSPSYAQLPLCHHHCPVIHAFFITKILGTRSWLYLLISFLDYWWWLNGIFFVLCASQIVRMNLSTLFSYILEGYSMSSLTAGFLSYCLYQANNLLFLRVKNRPLLHGPWWTERGNHRQCSGKLPCQRGPES